MTYAYNISVKGLSHTKDGSPCQDSGKLVIISDHLVIGCVGDGLGSAEHSDFGSLVAVMTAVRYCERKISEDSQVDEILSIVRESFQAAEDNVVRWARIKGYDIESMDTTLELAVFINGTVVYGHSGDSGTVLLTRDGKYCQPILQQRDQFGCVFPLVGDSHIWEFGYQEGVAGFLLATDGLFDRFIPPCLIVSDADIDVDMVSFFMDPTRMMSQGIEQKISRIEQFLNSIPSEVSSDDKTVVVFVDDRSPISRQPKEYYQRLDLPHLQMLYESYVEQVFRESNLVTPRISAPSINCGNNTCCEQNSLESSLDLKEEGVKH